MKYSSILTIIFLSIIITSCDKNEDSENPNPTILGCTDVNATNYNPNANTDDGSCTYTTYGCTNELAVNYDPNAVEDDGSCIILGCTDANAINYNIEATNDDGSCEYTVAYLLNGNWNIVSLEYYTEIDLSDIPTVGAFLGIQQISGEASDAGTWSFQYPEYLYNNNLDFDTEPINIAGFDVPGIPIELSSNGNWELTNNDYILITTDLSTNLESNYEILSIQSNSAFVNGTIPFSQEIMGFNFDLQIEVEMQLIKQ